jgi:hypothetical protein
MKDSKGKTRDHPLSLDIKDKPTSPLPTASRSSTPTRRDGQVKSNKLMTNSSWTSAPGGRNGFVDGMLDGRDLLFVAKLDELTHYVGMKTGEQRANLEVNSAEMESIFSHKVQGK